MNATRVSTRVRPALGLPMERIFTLLPTFSLLFGIGLAAHAAAPDTVVAWGAGRAGKIGTLHYGQSAVPANLGEVKTLSANGFTSIALKYSRFIRAMLVIGISFGQTASHSPSFEQLPNPSLSA